MRSAVLFLVMCVGTAACGGASTASSSKDHARCVAAVREAAKHQEQPGSQEDANRDLEASLRRCNPQEWFTLQVKYTHGLERGDLTLIRDLACDESPVRNYQGCEGAPRVPDTPCATSIIRALTPEGREPDPAQFEVRFEHQFQACTRKGWITVMRRLDVFSEKELQTILARSCASLPTSTACRPPD